MEIVKRNLFYGAAILALISGIAINDAYSQVSNGRVTTAAPSYNNNTTQPLSLDTNGGLRISGSFSATSEADASATAPSYSPGLEPLSQTLSGELRTTLTTPIPAGTNNIGDVDVLSLPPIPAGTNSIGYLGTMSSLGISNLTATTAQVVKASAGTFYGYAGLGVDGFFTWYDNATACSGTIIAVTWNPGVTLQANYITAPMGIAFSNGLTFCANINSGFYGTVYFR